jgi:signal transduction histidine kinase
MIISLAYYLIRTYHEIQENKKEKEIYRAKMEFFTNIAHEIKTPLTLIKGPIENLSEMTVSLPQIQEDVRTMERNTDRLVNLINQILDFRQTETKGFSLDFSEVNITEIAKEAFLTFQPLAKKRSLRYTLRQPASPIHIMADAEALTKILNNLISNAVKYAQHEATINVLPPQKEINKLSIEISNDGFIIPSEMKEKIFEPFFRIKDTNKQKGTGLGLALVRSLVELHNGKVYVKDQESNCNVFVVELPYPGIQKGRKGLPEKSNQIT